MLEFLPAKPVKIMLINCFLFYVINLLPVTDGLFSVHSMTAEFYVRDAWHRNTKSRLTDVVYDTLKSEGNYDCK
jgi:hypothetical protein